MNVETQISKSQRILAELLRGVKQLHEMGVPDTDKVFVVFSVRIWQERMKIELLAYQNWEQRYWMHNTENLNMN